VGEGEGRELARCDVIHTLDNFFLLAFFFTAFGLSFTAFGSSNAARYMSTTRAVSPHRMSASISGGSVCVRVCVSE
jgi:hypothetical protein